MKSLSVYSGAFGPVGSALVLIFGIYFGERESPFLVKCLLAFAAAGAAMLAAMATFNWKRDGLLTWLPFGRRAWTGFVILHWLLIAVIVSLPTLIPGAS